MNACVRVRRRENERVLVFVSAIDKDCKNEREGETEGERERAKKSEGKRVCADIRESVHVCVFVRVKKIERK